MRNKYNQQLQNQNILKNTFLPMLCSKPSMISDVVAFPIHAADHKSISNNNDPVSPRVSCIGQVKRHNRVITFPSTTTTAAAAAANNANYFKLKKLFSSKNLIATTTTTTTTSHPTGIRNSGRHRRNQTATDYSTFGFDDVSSVADLDPPLPVMIKRVPNGEDSSGDGENLWRRRTKSGGVALTTLQIQQIQIPNQIQQARSV